MKNKLLAIFALLLIPVAVYASLDSGNMGGEYRSFQYFIPFFQEPLATDQTVGTEGVVYAVLNAATAAIDESDTADIYALPYPAKVLADIVDSSGDTTPACTSVKLWGTTQFGKFVNEELVLSTFTESSTVTSKYAYERVVRITATCSGFDADDDFVLRMTEHVGLPLKISEPTLVLQVCNITRGADGSNDSNYTCHEVSSADGTRVFASSRVDTVASTINLEGMNANVPEGDMVVVRGRASIR